MKKKIVLILVFLLLVSMMSVVTGLGSEKEIAALGGKLLGTLAKNQQAAQINAAQIKCVQECFTRCCKSNPLNYCDKEQARAKAEKRQVQPKNCQSECLTDNPTCSKFAGQCPDSSIAQKLCMQEAGGIPIDQVLSAALGMLGQNADKAADDAEKVGLDDPYTVGYGDENDLDCDCPTCYCDLEEPEDPVTVDSTEDVCIPGYSPYHIDGEIKKVYDRKHMILTPGTKISGPCIDLTPLTELEIRINDDGTIEIFGGKFQLTKPLSNVRFDLQPRYIPEIVAPKSTVFDLGPVDVGVRKKKEVKVTGEATIRGLFEDGPLEFDSGKFFASENTLFFSSDDTAQIDNDYSFNTGVGASLPYESAAAHIQATLDNVPPPTGAAIAASNLNVPTVIGKGGHLSKDSRVVASSASGDDSPDTLTLDPDGSPRFRIYNFNGAGIYFEDSLSTEDLITEPFKTAAASLRLEYGDASQKITINQGKQYIIRELGKRLPKAVSDYMPFKFSGFNTEGKPAFLGDLNAITTELFVRFKNDQYGETVFITPDALPRFHFERNRVPEDVKSEIAVNKKYGGGE